MKRRDISDSGSSSDGDCVVGSDGGNLEAEVEAEATEFKKRRWNHHVQAQAQAEERYS